MRNLFYILVFVFISAYLCVGTGRLELFGGLKFYLNTIYLAFCIFLFLHFRYAFWLFFICILFFAIYAPVGILNDPINDAFILAIWGTYASEAKEFVQNLPISYILLSIFSVIFVLFAYFKMPKCNFSKKEIFTLFMIFIIATATEKLWHIAPSSTIIKAVKNFSQSYDELKSYKNIEISPEWKISEVSPKYQNFVVIIGESVRKDYMQIYGYNQPNSPFLSSVNGEFIDGFTATAINTIPNLKALLNYNGNFNLNIIDLANMAGFETFWLSNQGYLGIYDTPTTIIAKRVDHKYFLENDPNFHKKMDNFLVLKFGEFLNQKPNNRSKGRVFFLHLYGSHLAFCKRLRTKDYQNYKDKMTFYLNCYNETITQTDSDLREIYKILMQNFKEKNQTFSMIYFSDHGLSTIMGDGIYNLAVKDSPSLQAL